MLLTRYYPFAGEVINNSHIECNDSGVYFVEARVNHSLEEFLLQPDDHKVDWPFHELDTQDC